MIKNPYPEEVRFNGLRLAEFDSVFSVIVPLENLDKPACAHHALKALEAALKNKALSGLEDQLKMGLSDAFKDFIKRSNYGFSQWRSFMVGNKSYTFKHVLNFNLEGKGLLIDFMQSLKEWLEPEEIVFANDGYGGYYLLNTASGVVLFLDTDDGSKHALLHLKMFLKKLESRG